ncbi:23S rRNA pseudouridine(2605) synthase [Gammaproteobacteria bacterium]
MSKKGYFDQAMMNNEKLHKVLARAGVGSRREVETWIEAGRISVDGVCATLGLRVTGRERIRIDGQPVSLRASPRRRVLLYHKPEGEVCTRKDPEGRPTLFDHLPLVRNSRWVAVGRLDFNTSGLIILTTDGELAHRLMHPARELEREYAMRVLGSVDEATLKSLCTGIELADGQAHFERLTDAGGEGANHWYRGTVKEGRNREVRRLWESQGIQVSRLIRVRFGPVALPRGLHRGRWEEATPEVVTTLLRLVGMDDSSTSEKEAGPRPSRPPNHHRNPRPLRASSRKASYA